MFEDDVAGLDTAGALAAVVQARADENEAARRGLLVAAHYADLHPDPATIPGDRSAPGRERGLYYGGPGCPGVAEFAVAEYGVVLGVSTESAAKNIGQALALRHRLPFTWERVVAGEATPWKARQIATACQELSLDAAAIVDERVAPVVDTVGPVQLRNIVKAAKWEADPEAARAAAEQKARERGVWTGRSDEHGTTPVFVKAATGDVIRFDATINQIADALTALDGPAPTLQTQRVKAFGILTDPALAHQLLQVAQYLAANPSTADPALSTVPAPGSEPVAAGPTPESASVSESDLGPADDLRPGDQAPAGQADVVQTEDVTKDGELASDLFLADEPGANSEADRDAPHPSSVGHPFDPPSTARSDTGTAREVMACMDAAVRRDLAAKLSIIKTAADGAGRTSGGPRPGRTKLYVHLTDETLLAGGGTMRVEQFGPVYAKLAELVGHDRITVQPVIDLHDQINENAYEISRALRERIKLAYPVEQFPYGPGETTDGTDLDHVIPFDPAGPSGQTSTGNLRPLRRRSHRIKTFAGWKSRPVDANASEWTTRHGYRFRVDHTGTRPITEDLRPV